MTIYNHQNAFDEWLKANLKPSSGAISSYKTCLELLSNAFVKNHDIDVESLYEIEDLDVLENLYHKVLDIQKDPRSYICYGNPDSYGKKGFYSAAIKKYIEYLKSKSNGGFVNIAALNIPKPFLILAGISGTGKTRFVRKQVEQNGGLLKEHYCLIPVRPDWHEPSDLLGYVSRVSGSPEYVTTDLLKFIAKAWKGLSEHTDFSDGVLVDLEQLSLIKTYWLCLDEMNLAPVEQYFADFLSVLETREYGHQDHSLRYQCDPLISADTVNAHAMQFMEAFGLSNDDKLWQYFLAEGISLPMNLIVVGTVNMDETTHGFSRKVIDRALTLDFGEYFPNDYGHYFDNPYQPIPLVFPRLSAVHSSQQFAVVGADSGGTKTLAFIRSVNDKLKGTAFELAYRALNELYVSLISYAPKSETGLQSVWDDFIMCKVLPRIEGDQDKLQSIQASDKTILDDLLELLANNKMSSDDNREDLLRHHVGSEKPITIKYRSATKLIWMKRKLDLFGFTSFWP